MPTYQVNFTPTIFTTNAKDSSENYYDDVSSDTSLLVLMSRFGDDSISTGVDSSMVIEVEVAGPTDLRDAFNLELTRRLNAVSALPLVAYSTQSIPHREGWIYFPGGGIGISYVALTNPADPSKPKIIQQRLLISGWDPYLIFGFTVNKVA